jgi:peptidoglycan/LPS O-acetylase OafA/YrhL
MSRLTLADELDRKAAELMAKAGSQGDRDRRQMVLTEVGKLRAAAARLRDARKARTRRILTAVSAAYLVLVGALVGRVPLPVLNDLLVLLVFPLVWLIWAGCRWSAHQHADKYANDVVTVHGAPQARVAVRR